MTTQSLRNVSMQELARLLRAGEPFINGKLEGIPEEVEDPGELPLGLAERYYADLPSYTVLSDGLPIAWRRRAGGWVLAQIAEPSHVTTAHMRRVAEALSLP